MPNLAKNVLHLGLALVAVFSIAACGGQEREGALARTSQAAHSAEAKGGGEAKVTVCHIPPGNPDNRHEIEVGAPAVDAHIAHGDFLGSCTPQCSGFGQACATNQDCCQAPGFPLFCSFRGLCGGAG